jgi:hypothetical protein
MLVGVAVLSLGSGIRNTLGSTCSLEKMLELDESADSSLKCSVCCGFNYAFWKHLWLSRYNPGFLSPYVHHKVAFRVARSHQSDFSWYVYLSLADVKGWLWHVTLVIPHLASVQMDIVLFV